MNEDHKRTQWWLPIAGMIILAFVVGISGGSVLSPIVGAFFTPTEENAPLEDASDVKRRADIIAGESPDAKTLVKPQTAPPTDATSNGDSLTLQPPAEATTPPPKKDTRSLERHLLALDSPLTPAVTEIAARISQHRKQRLAARAPSKPGIETGTKIATHTGAGLSPGQIEIRQTIDAPRRHVLARGAVIPAVLQSPIDSALPGLVRAQVSDNVYDSLTGRHILIPRGARLIGKYGQGGGSGARRLFVAWSDLRMPDGTPIDLDKFTTLGSDGASGLKGRRSTGFWKALGAAVLFDLAGNTTAILTNQQAEQESDLGALAGAALGNASSRVASDYIGSLLAQGSRFKVPAGSFMNVLVEQDMSLPAQPQPEARRR